MPGIEATAGLDPRVPAVRALAGATDADPAGNVPCIDARRAGEHDRGADAVPAVRGLVSGVGVAAGPRAAAGMPGRRMPSWRRRRTRRRSGRRRGRRGGAAARTRSDVGVPTRASHPSFLRSGPDRGGPDPASCRAYNAARWRRPRTAARPSRSTTWRANVYDRAPERTDELFSTISGIENEPLVDAGERRRRLRPRPRLPGRVPVHARRLSVDVPRPPLDDAPVRRLRHAGGDERALPLPHEHGQTGLSTAFDMPTLMGYDSDHARSLGEVGTRRASPSTRSPTWRRSSRASRSATSRPR